MKSEKPVLHIYGQAQPGADAYLIGNMNGLYQLWDELEKAIAGVAGRAMVRSKCRDGAGYSIRMIQIKGKRELGRLALPYGQGSFKAPGLQEIWKLVGQQA